jgi:ornithine cyclodeaminase
LLIYHREQIEQALNPPELIQSLEEGFVAYSEGRVVVPPVGHLYFDVPPGECHIKYGYMVGDDLFVIKVATGFYQNPDLGFPSSNGLILLFNQKNGSPEALLLDDGYLTDLRTALAGAIAAKHLAPREVSRIGIVGTGVQARLQLELLRSVTPCRDVIVWGRSRTKAELYKENMVRRGFSINVASQIEDIGSNCNLIITTTSSRTPLLYADQIRPGTHITAVGADGGGKQELDAELFKKSDICAVDSLKQCREYGDSSYALKNGFISEEQLIELGMLIKHSKLSRSNDDQITVADLTGVAVQDIEIAKLAFSALHGAALDEKAAISRAAEPFDLSK